MSKIIFTPDNYKTYFTSASFRQLEPAQRQELVKYTVEQIRNEKGLKNVNVQFEDMGPSSRGSCSQNYGIFKQFNGHTLTLNSDVLTSKKVSISYSTYNTINHELEHADQYEHAVDRSIKNDDAVTLEQRLNDQHYYSASGDKIIHLDDGKARIYRFDSETDFQLYRAQACEADARQAGLKAVEDLKNYNQSKGIEDIFIDDYIEATRANEIAENRTMMDKLGMHSRESLAREELSHVSQDKVTVEERAKIIDYAREKDFETAKQVLQDDAYGKATEAELRRQFDNNIGYQDFYSTDYYKANKVADNDRSEYKFAKYKWSDDGENSDNIQSGQREAFRRVMDNSSSSQQTTQEKREAFSKEMRHEGEHVEDVSKRRAFSESMSDDVRNDGDASNTQTKGAELKVGR